MLNQSSTMDSIQSDVRHNYKLAVKTVHLVVDNGLLIQEMQPTDLAVSSISLPTEMNHLLEVLSCNKFARPFVKQY